MERREGGTLRELCFPLKPSLSFHSCVLFLCMIVSGFHDLLVHVSVLEYLFLSFTFFIDSIVINVPKIKFWYHSQKTV